MHNTFQKFHFSLLFFFIASCSLGAQDTLYILDKQARFPGGEREFSMYWERAMRTKPKPFQKVPKGEGVVAFTIDEKGAVRDVFIKKSLNLEMDAKALKSIQNMPIWEPAERNGRPVAAPLTMSFFVLPKDEDGNLMIDPDVANTEIPQRGFTFSLWAGSTISTGDYADYLRPTRFVMGLQAGYTFKHFSLGLEYDIFNISRVQKPFQVEGKLFTPDRHRFSAINLYFPLAVRLKINKKWQISPYFSPVLNNATINPRGSSNGDAFNYGWLSFGGGVYIDRLMDRSAFLNRKDKKYIIDSYIRTRVFVTPMHFHNNTSTDMQGTVINLSFGIHGIFRRE